MDVKVLAKRVYRMSCTSQGRVKADTKTVAYMDFKYEGTYNYYRATRATLPLRFRDVVQRR